MKKFLILTLSAALLLAFFGCGSPKEDKEDNTKPDTTGLESVPLELPTSTDADKATTGENNSKMYKFTGEDFTKIKEANPGSLLVLIYKTTTSVTYACGEIGWKSITEAGPVISGNGTGKKQEAYIDVKFLADIMGTDNFTIHMFNSAELLEATLMAAPDDYEVEPNPKATAGATPIFIPSGAPFPGNGDLSKVDYKKITDATSGTLVFYFENNTVPDNGILKFGPKSGDEYAHYGISKDGTPVYEGGDGWRAYTATEGGKEGEGTITYTVAEIKAAIPLAVADAPKQKPGKVFNFNKLEINQGQADDKKWDLVYIELKK